VARASLTFKFSSSSVLLHVPMLTFSDFPTELLVDLLSLALEAHPTPSDLLRVNTRFHNIGQIILHSHLRFHHLRQVAEFASGTIPLACSPRTLTIDIYGATILSTDATFSVFRYLIPVLRRCGAEPAETSETGQAVQLPLNRLELYLNTHSRDPQLRFVYDALRLTK